MVFKGKEWDFLIDIWYGNWLSHQEKPVATVVRVLQQASTCILWSGQKSIICSYFIVKYLSISRVLAQ